VHEPLLSTVVEIPLDPAAAVGVRDRRRDQLGEVSDACSVTASKISGCEAPRATSVATRRRAACSPTSAWRSERAWALPIAVAISSVNAATRASVSSGNGSSPVDTAKLAPHTQPSTSMGAPMTERTPRRRASAANEASAGSTSGPNRSGPGLARRARSGARWAATTISANGATRTRVYDRERTQRVVDDPHEPEQREQPLACERLLGRMPTSHSG
jgi:hypothetical protein